MAALLFLAQLLFLGALVGPAQAQAQAQSDKCAQLLKATAGNFSVDLRPKVYQANTTYTVTINSTGTKTPVQYLLQALVPQNESLGQWMGVTTENCTSVDTAVLNATQKAANWTSPDRNVASVQIRAYVIFTDNTVQFKTQMLQRESEPTVSPRTTPNSAPRAPSSSFCIAVLQLPLLLATSKLLS